MMVTSHVQASGAGVVDLPPHPFAYRQCTQDASAIRDIYLRNEYRLPDAFAPGDVVLDVGAHIGTFARACLDRGAQVVCYEPEADNFLYLARNAPEAELHRKAVWGNLPGSQLKIQKCYPYTALNHVSDEGEPVEWEPLDDILVRLGQVRLLKLDCEVSEYPILYTAKELGRVKQLVLEYHNFPDLRFEGKPFTGAALAEYLEGQGWDVTREDNPEGNGLVGWIWGHR